VKNVKEETRAAVVEILRFIGLPANERIVNGLASIMDLYADKRVAEMTRERKKSAKLLTACADMLAQAEDIIRDDQDEVDEDEEGYLPLIAKARNHVYVLTGDSADAAAPPRQGARHEDRVGTAGACRPVG